MPSCPQWLFTHSLLPSVALHPMPPVLGESSTMPSCPQGLFTHAFLSLVTHHPCPHALGDSSPMPSCPQWLSIRALLLLTTSSQLSDPLSVGRFPAFGTSVTMTVASTFIFHMVFYKAVCVCQFFPVMFVWCPYCSLMSAYAFISCITLII